MDHVHFIGIGGTGLSAIARVLLEIGHTVSGSDRQNSPLAQAVEAAGGRVYLGHRAENIENADVIVRSSAIPDENVEVQAAISHGIPVLKRADFLGRLMTNHLGIAVSGTHGKTTTTAMVAWVLTHLDQDPSYILGGTISGWGSNAHAGSGNVFVIEADEYDRMFLGLTPQIAVVTNVEHDHPDCFPTLEDFFQAFRDFIGCLPSDGVLLACGDDPGALQMVPVAQVNSNQVFTYGIRNPSCDYSTRNISQGDSGGFEFDFYRNGVQLSKVSLVVPGEHNVQNAMAALAVVHQLGLSVADAARALATFQGTERRFEIIGQVEGVTLISDYAHHPTEIRATLAAARWRYPDQTIWAIWQPHTYSRTKMLFDEFASSFSDADVVVVTEVFPAREPVDPEFSAAQIVAAIRKKSVHFEPVLKDAADFILKNIAPNDVVIVLSAGDANLICTQLLKGLKVSSP